MTLENPEALVRESLERFGIDSTAAITFIKYRENHVYRVDDETESYAFRLHRPHYRNDREINTELQFLVMLRERGLNVPEIVPALNGDFFVIVGSGERGRRVSAQRWIEGAEPLGDGNGAFLGTRAVDAEIFRQIGRKLAALHNDLQNIGRPEWFERSPWDADGLAGKQPLWGDPLKLRSLTGAQIRVIDDAVNLLHEELSSLSRDARHFGVIHADLTVENIMTSADGLTFIDFDDFGEGWYLFDLTTILFFFTPHPEFSAAKDALLAGYESVRPLSAQEHGAWNAMMLARALTYLGWAAERPGDDASNFIEDHVGPWVVGLAEHYVAAKRPNNRTRLEH